MASYSSSIKLSLKLLIDTERERVLFAEASKEVIDFLFNFLCLPLGTVVRLLNKDGMVGSIGNLYDCVESLNQAYIEPNQNKDFLLNPTTLNIFSTEFSSLLHENDCIVDDNSEASKNVNENSGSSKFYTCPYHESYVTCDNNTCCPQCNHNMNFELCYVSNMAAEEKLLSKSVYQTKLRNKKHSKNVRFVSVSLSPVEIFNCVPANYCSFDKDSETKLYTCGSERYSRCYVTRDKYTCCPRCSYYMNVALCYASKKAEKEKKGYYSKSGFVKGDVTYLVMDDLVVQPMSTISGIALLNKFNVKEIGLLQERVVELGITEGINLLKASLQSKMVLTSVFLKNIGS